MSQVPSSRLYSMPGLSEQMQEKAKEKIFGLRIDYLLKLADLCKRVFVSGDHVPDPETVSLIAGDFKDKYSDEPTIPDWAPKTTVAPKIDGSPSQSAGPIPKTEVAVNGDASARLNRMKARPSRKNRSLPTMFPKNQNRKFPTRNRMMQTFHPVPTATG